MSKYSNIIFDIDGTLVDTYLTGLGSLQAVMEKMLHVKPSLKELEPYFGIPSFQAAKMIYPQDWKLFLEEWEEFYVQMHHYSHLFDGVVDMLSVLKRQGKKLGIVTSRAYDELQRDPIMNSIIDMFDVVVTSKDSSKYKPDPEPTLAFLSKAKASSEECLYVGDTIFDSKCALGAGVNFALVDWKGIAAEDIPATYRVHNTKEILAIC